MTAYQQKSFTVHLGNKDFSAGWERIFAPELETLECKEDTMEIARRLPQTYDETKYTLAAAQAKLEEEELREVTYEPSSLPAIQRRLRHWAEHNFPLKITVDHRRTASEFMCRVFNCNADLAEEFYGSETADLAYLLAATQGRNHRPLIGAVEELGELCHAHLKNEQGIRGTPEEHRVAKQDAIGDTLIYLLDYCNKEGFCMQECLEIALAETSSRDWVRFPKNGKTE